MDLGSPESHCRYQKQTQEDDKFGVRCYYFLCDFYGSVRENSITVSSTDDDDMIYMHGVDHYCTFHYFHETVADFVMISNLSVSQLVVIKLWLL